MQLYIISKHHFNFTRIGKPHKKPEGEVYGRSQPGRSSEKSLSREALERHTRMDERIDEDSPSQPRYYLLL